jgi:hypothetical protein
MNTESVLTNSANPSPKAVICALWRCLVPVLPNHYPKTLGHVMTPHSLISAADGRLPQQASKAGVRRPTELAAGDEGHDDVGGVPVQVLAAPVVHRGRPGVGVPGGNLDLSEGYPGVEKRP